MDEKESLEHIEMFVYNKIKEGYGGLFPKRGARSNVLCKWDIYKDKGANLEAVTVLGGNDKVLDYIKVVTDRVLSSKEELQKVLKGDYLGSQEDLLGAIWKD